jgi:hypothetical protein
MSLPPFLTLSRGPRPYQAILSSPHRQEIDTLLFEEKCPVREVYRRIQDLGDTEVSYVTLTRYKNARLKESERSDSELRFEEVRRDVETLGRIIDKGLEMLDAGWTPRMAEMLRAIELRGNLLQQFPDASESMKHAARRQLEDVIEVIKDVISEEQRREIVRRLTQNREGEE